jgi:hypothetical protein
MERLSSHWPDFDEIWYLSFFRKSVRKIQVSVKCDKNNKYFTPIPVAEQCKAWICSRSPAGIAGLNPVEGMDVCLLWVLCFCQVEDSATDWSLVQRIPTDCGASSCVISKPQDWGG